MATTTISQVAGGSSSAVQVSSSSSSSTESTYTLRPNSSIVTIPHQAPQAATSGWSLVVASGSQQSDSPSIPSSHALLAPSGFAIAATTASTSSSGIQRTRRPPSQSSQGDSFPKAQGTGRPAPARRGHHQHSPFAPIMVENSINVALAMVPSAPPPPTTAPPLSLSYRAGIDPKRIFVEESQYLQCQEQRRVWNRLGRHALAAAETMATQASSSLLPSSSSPPPSSSSSSPNRPILNNFCGTMTPSSSSLTRPTPESLTLETSTPASTLPTTPLSPSLKSDLSAAIDPRQDSSIPDSTTPTPNAQARTPVVPAWSKPRAWGGLTSKDSGAMSFIMPASSSASNHGGVDLPTTAANSSTSGPSTHTGTSSGRSHTQHHDSRSWSRQPRPPLEKLLADAHTSFSAPLTLPRGLINKGNFCFANAILQVLVFCAPFYNLFTKLGEEISADFANATPLMEAVVQFLREFPIADQRRNAKANGRDNGPGAAENDLVVNSQLSEPLMPENVYAAMKLNKRFDLMRRGHQEDAEEFLGFFLDTLHEELLSAIQRSNSRYAASQKGGKASDASKEAINGGTTADSLTLDPLAGGGESDLQEERVVQRPASPSEEGWMEVGQKGKTAFTRTTSSTESPITRMFGGKLRSILRTPGAKDSVTLEPYQPLQLDIQPAHVHTIEDALLNLTVPESIPGVYSPARGGVVDATKQVFIERTPPILVLHLKRFLYDEVGGVQKNAKEVGYGHTLEVGGDMVSPTRRSEGSTRYRLFGVVYHHGRYASGGHYTVDVLRQDGSGWIHFDDTTFGPLAAEHVGRRAGQQLRGNAGHDGLAYLLFYKRMDLVAGGETSTASHHGINGDSTMVNGHVRLATSGSTTSNRTKPASNIPSPTTNTSSGRSKKNEKDQQQQHQKHHQQQQQQQQQIEVEVAKPRRTVPGAAPSKKHK